MAAKSPFQDPPQYPAPSGQTMYAAHLLDPDGATVEVGFFAAASDDDAAKAVAALTAPATGLGGGRRVSPVPRGRRKAVVQRRG